MFCVSLLGLALLFPNDHWLVRLSYEDPLDPDLSETRTVQRALVRYVLRRGPVAESCSFSSKKVDEDVILTRSDVFVKSRTGSHGRPRV